MDTTTDHVWEHLKMPFSDFLFHRSQDLVKDFENDSLEMAEEKFSNLYTKVEPLVSQKWSEVISEKEYTEINLDCLRNKEPLTMTVKYILDNTSFYEFVYTEYLIYKDAIRKTIEE